MSNVTLMTIYVHSTIVGNSLPLCKIPLGTSIHNIELTLGKGGQIVRSAGNYGQVMAKEASYAQIKLPSGV